MRAKNVVATVVCLLTCAMFAQKRNITEKDIFDFTWIGDTQLSPDGSRAAYVQTTVNAKRDGYDTAIYLLDTGQPMAAPRRLTNGPHDAQPRWSPDGTQLAFTRAVEKDGKPQPAQLYVLSLAGGEPVQVSSMEKGVGSPQWAPNGTCIAVLSGTPIVPEPKTEKKDGSATKEKAEERKSDVRIITKAVYRNNGTGYIDTKDASQLYLFSTAKIGAKPLSPWQVTAGRFSVSDFVWSPSSSDIYYTSEHTDEPYYDLPHNEIYVLGIAADAVAKEEKTPPPMSMLVAKLTFGASDLTMSPDGKKLAFHGEDQPLAKPRSHQQPDMFVLDLDAKGAPRNLTANYDYEVGSGVGGDNTAPRGGGRSGPVWTADGKSIIDVVGKQGSALLVSIDAKTGAVKELTPEKQAVVGFAVKPDATKMLALVSTPVSIGDLFSVATDGSEQQTRLTDVNKALFSQLNLTMPEDMQVTPTANAKDIPGSKIESFVQLPPDFHQTNGDKTKKYPLILNIHGGPHSAYGWVFDHEMQWMAAKGYVVVYPNPRGSTTYGQQFANVIQHNYPGDDFHDLMDCVDAVVKLGYVDAARMGVTGGSGGGLLTDWTVTQTNRFKAAVSQRDITDWTNWWYTADFTLFQPTWFEGAPFDKMEEFRKYSPITYVTNIRTPMLFILGEADYRTPPTGGGEDFFRALKYRHIDTVMVRFPGESHELSRSGQPWHRVERLENIVNWFDKYLMDMPEPQYDIVPAGATPASVKTD
ncbi:MAG TPA: S9 family peptidase [Edaphobacter sp.]|nr:S9 family peptidase [Edaphobacter sp.]